ncbi:MAG: SRPBCC family protein [Microthrixaceae bacterium]
MASIRREIRIDAPVADVWPLVGDPGRIHQWFPGIVDCTVDETDDGTVRTVTLGSGISLEEHVVTNDPIAHRFQYRIVSGVFKQHLGTVDVIGLDDTTSLAVYSTDALPDVMALVIGGASGVALENIKSLAEEATR